MSGYFKQEHEKDRRKRKENWELAIGLQQVDNLVPSEYLIEVAKQNIQGEISYEKVHELLYSRYGHGAKEDKADKRQMECDIVSARISDYLSNSSFTLSPETFRSIHEFLFKDIYDFAGKYRKYNLKKKEPVLGGRSVVYADFRNITTLLDYDFKEEKEFSYRQVKDKKGILKRIAVFSSNIWQVHPFMEGNTRTTALFMECYLNAMGFHLDNQFFAENAKYFRNALVRANYADFSQGIYAEPSYLQAFYENLLFQGTHKLKNRDLIIRMPGEGINTF